MEFDWYISDLSIWLSACCFRFRSTCRDFYQICSILLRAQAVQTNAPALCKRLLRGQTPSPHQINSTCSASTKPPMEIYSWLANNNTCKARKKEEQKKIVISRSSNDKMRKALSALARTVQQARKQVLCVHWKRSNKPQRGATHHGTAKADS